MGAVSWRCRLFLRSSSPVSSSVESDVGRSYQELLERAVTGHDSITNSKRRHGHFETFPYQQLRNSAALGFGG